MKKYILSVCSFFVAAQIVANNTPHTEGIVKKIGGNKSFRVPVYYAENSNTPSGDTYIRTEKISGYNVGKYSRASRKKTRKGTFTISTIKKSVIEDDATRPLEKTPVSGATKNIVGFVRNTHYSPQEPTAGPERVPLYEYTGTLSSAPAKKTALIAPEKTVKKEAITTNKK